MENFYPKNPKKKKLKIESMGGFHFQFLPFLASFSVLFA